MKVWVFENDEPVEVQVTSVEIRGRFLAMATPPVAGRTSWYPERAYHSQEEARAFQKECLLESAALAEEHAKDLRARAAGL
jgi:hypothetical protein